MSFLPGRMCRHAVLSVPRCGLLEKNIAQIFRLGGLKYSTYIEVPGSGNAGGRIGGCGDGRSWNSGSSAGAAGTGDGRSVLMRRACQPRTAPRPLLASLPPALPPLLRTDDSGDGGTR